MRHQQSSYRRAPSDPPWATGQGKAPRARRELPGARATKKIAEIVLQWRPRSKPRRKLTARDWGRGVLAVALAGIFIALLIRARSGGEGETTAEVSARPPATWSVPATLTGPLAYERSTRMNGDPAPLVIDNSSSAAPVKSWHADFNGPLMADGSA